MLNINKCKEVEAVLKNLVDTNKLPGYQIAIISNKQKYVNCYGYSKLIPEKSPLSLSTKYDMASLSKLLSTASCMLKLLEEGKVDLEDKVSKYLDVYEKDITILECITHTTGFNDDDIADYKSYSDEKFIESLLNMKSHPELKGNVKYSDTNFIYLGFIIEKLTGSFANFAVEKVFKPLGMMNTSYNPQDKDNCAATEVTEARGIIKGVVHDGKGFRLNGVSGSSGLFSTIEDVIKYVEMILDDNNSFFSNESRELLRTVLADTPTGRRSFGWIISDPTMKAMGNRYSSHTLYHTGFTGGSIFIDLDKKLSLIVLCNRVHPTRKASYVLDAREVLHNKLYDVIK